MKFFSVFTLFLLFTIYSVSGEVINAKSGSRTDIQAAINLARQGDLVRIPAGTFNYDGSISMKAGITLMGEGQDKTVLKRTGSTSSYAFNIDGSNGLPARISGMTITGIAPTKSPGIKLINGCKNFRIDHITFRRCFDRAIETHGQCKGVIDHCTFIDNWYTAVVVYGDEVASWSRPINLGGDDAVFVEDCYFEQKNIGDDHMSHHVASNNGSRYVFRYNTTDDGYMSPQAIDVHGNKFGGIRGSRNYEIYKNKVQAEHRWLGMLIRGGDGVIWGNELTGDYTRPIDLMHEGRDGDGNCAYPCDDQIRSLYIWDNNYNGRTISSVNVRHPSLIKLGRDYFMTKMPGYVPYPYPHPLTVEPGVEPPTAVISKRVEGEAHGLSVEGGVNSSGSSARIHFSVPQSVSGQMIPVKLKIYNVQGELVRTLFEGQKKAGMHEMTWDGFSGNRQKLANGIYTLELEIDGVRVNGQIVIYGR